MSFKNHKLNITIIFIFSLFIYHCKFNIETLSPSNDVWLQEGDMGAQYAAWLYFKNAPWKFPFGEFNNMLDGLNSNISLTDSIPLLVIPLKVFRDYLPISFQFFGIWLLFCFFMNGVIGFKIGKLFTEKGNFPLHLGLIFSFAPVILFRTGHVALCSHWLFLYPIYVSLKISRLGQFNNLNLVGLVLSSIASILTQPYLFAMNIPLFLVVCIQLFIFKDNIVSTISFYNLFFWFSFSIASSFLIAYLVGTITFEELDSLKAPGFTTYSADLLTFINSFDTSLLIPHIRSRDSQYEGYAYLGFGLILAIGLIAICKNSCIKSEKLIVKNLYPLTFVVLLMGIYSLSSHIRVAGNVIINLDYFYNFLISITETFRTCGRFIWPLHYCLIILILLSVVSRVPTKYANRILSFIFIVQFLDLAYPLITKKLSYQKSSFGESIEDILQNNNLTNIKLIPHHFFYTDKKCDNFQFTDTEYNVVAIAGAKYRTSINSGFSARFPDKYIKVLCERYNRWKKDKEVLVKGSLYIFHPNLKAEALDRCRLGFTLKELPGNYIACYSKI